MYFINIGLGYLVEIGYSLYWGLIFDRVVLMIFYKVLENLGISIGFMRREKL